MTYTEKQNKQRITLGESGNTLVMLIAICGVMFVGLAFMKAIWFFRFPKELAPSLFTKNVLGWFSMPADVHSLLNRPWTVITQMFVHDNIWKVFTNMLWLWCFGYIMQDLTGNKKIVPVFVYGALGGALAFLLAYNFLPSLKAFTATATTLGASAGVMAVAVATTLVSPGYRIFPLLKGGIPLWILTVLYMTADFATVSISDAGTLITHFAGALSGFLFIFFLRMGYDGGAWMNNLFDWINNLFNPDKPAKGKSTQEALFYKSTSAPFKKTPNVTQERIDNILDKINYQGYQSLTDEEKDLLKRAGKEEL
ncbi:MAG: rhomboid family intramembrane serine protease [Chitinophagaceae bacterium]